MTAFHAQKTGWLTGAMLGLTACASFATAVVIPTPQWADYSSAASLWFGGRPLPVGAVVDAYDPTGIHCGHFEVTNPGHYGFMPVYGDDPLTPEDEGAETGDIISFKLDGFDATFGSSTTWDAQASFYDMDMPLFSDTLTLTGSVTLNSTGIPTPGLTRMVIIGSRFDVLDSVVINTDGSFVTTTIFPDSLIAAGIGIEPLLYGLTAFDASLILQHMVGLRPLSTSELFVADVTGDGNISALDATHILERVVGNRTAFLTGYDWPSVETPAPFPPAGSTSGVMNFSVRLLGDITNSYGQGQPKTGQSQTRYVSWSGAEGGWTLSIDDLSGIYSADLVLTVPFGEKVYTSAESLLGNVFLVDSQKDDTLHVSFASAGPLSGSGPILLFSSQSRPTLVSASADEGKYQIIVTNPTALGESVLPTRTTIRKIFPNPANPTTSINCDLARAGEVRLTIHTIAGQTVRELVDGGRKNAGVHRATWDGRDQDGRPVASDVYLIRLTLDLKVSTTRRVIILR